MDKIKCKKCDGKGYIYEYDDRYMCPCDKCGGQGKLDWTENVLGPSFNIKLSFKKVVANTVKKEDVEVCPIDTELTLNFTEKLLYGIKKG